MKLEFRANNSMGIKLVFGAITALGLAKAFAETASSAGTTAITTVATANPYGLEALWAGSDLVTKVVLLLLLIMSMGSWYIMIVKVLEQSKMGRQAKDAQAF